MVKKHFGTDIERAVDTGADNALVKTNCAGWCEHIVVETVGVSMVGQMTGVPIGPHRISCRYARGAVESTVLRNLFGWFLQDNCISCPHYQAGSSPGYGRQVVEDIERRDSEQRIQVQRRKSRIEELRTRLKQSASDFADSSNTEAASIHRLAAELFLEVTDDQVVPALIESSTVAPDLFDGDVIEILKAGIADEAFVERCLPILTAVARQKPLICGEVAHDVMKTLDFDLSIELVADAIDACLVDPSEMEDEHLEKLVLRLDHQIEIVGSVVQKPREYRNAIRLLERVTQLDHARVISVFQNLLKHESNYVRANTCNKHPCINKLA